MLVVGHGDMRKWALAGLMQSGEPADVFLRVAEQHPRLGQIILQLAVTCSLLQFTWQRTQLSTAQIWSSLL